MPLKTIPLTLHQQSLLILAVEEQVTDLRSRATSTDLSTSAFLDDYQDLLEIVDDVVDGQVETPAPEETA